MRRAFSNFVFCMMVSCIVVLAQCRHERASAADVRDTSQVKTVTAESLLEAPLDGLQLTRIRDNKRAKEWADARLKIAPKDTDTLFLKAWLDDLTKDNSDCLEKTAKLISLKSHLGFAHKLRSDAYCRLKDWPRALSEINEAIGIMPHESILYTIRANILKKLGKESEAESNRQMCKILRQLYFAWISIVAEKYETVNPQYDPRTTFERNFAAGQKTFLMNDFSAAATYFTRALKQKPESKDLHLYRGTCYEALNQWQKAIDDYSWLIALGENSMIPLRVAPVELRNTPSEKWFTTSVKMAEAFKRRARCYCFLNKHKLALKDMDIAVKQEPEDRWTVEYRASVLSSSKQYKEAVAEYLRCEALQPTYMQAAPKLIVCLKQSGDHATAVKRLSWLLMQSKYDDGMLLDRADSLSKLGMHKEAIQDLTNVISTEPLYVKTYLLRAYEYETLGQLKNALADYESALSLDKQTTDASVKAAAGKEKVLHMMKGSR